jgi:hypothetical protein
MKEQAQSHGERRKNQRSHMTDDQFRDFTMDSLEEGRKQFAEIKSDVTAMSGHVKTLTGHMETMAAALAENTDLTRKTAVLAETTAVLAKTTAADTADLVSLSKITKGTTRAVKDGVIGTSKTIKVLWPIFIVIGIVAAWWHGEPIHIKDIIEAIK